MDNLYKVSIVGPQGKDAFHVQAPSAKTAVAKAFRKFSKRHPVHDDLTLHSLELVEEDFQ